MKSKANIEGHPLHQILVGFPVAFFSASFFFDCLGAFRGCNADTHVAMELSGLGIMAGLAAAITGLIDYLHTVPPKSSAKTRATKHGILNGSLLVLFSVAFPLHRHKPCPATWILILEGIGIVLMYYTGWLGGTLVSRNQIGIHNRYANAGKWQESDALLEGKRFLAALSGELEAGQMKLIHVDKKRIVLARTGKGYTAIDDRCTHKGGSLAGGVLINSIVQCPWHGSQFDCHNGTVHAGPATEPIKVYKTIVHEGKIWVEI